MNSDFFRKNFLDHQNTEKVNKYRIMKENSTKFSFSCIKKKKLKLRKN